MSDRGGHAPHPGARPTREPGGRVSGFYRLERWEVPPAPGSEGPPTIVGRALVDDHLRGPGGGLVTGGLLTGIDSLGGVLCGLAVLPRWIVTTNLAARVVRLDHVGPLRIEGRVLRQGRTSSVAALDVVDEGAADRPVASAVVTCAILDPGDMDLGFARPLVIPAPGPDPDAVPPHEFFRIEPGTGAVTRLELADHLRNPWGILHGGAVASLADVAASRAVEAVRGGPVASADTTLHFLSPLRTGPVEARCRIVGTRADGTVVRVAIHDLGVEDRLAALASVTVRRV